MTDTTVTVARIYLTEGEGQLERLLGLLRTQQRVRGFTAFRGIAGYGPSGALHTASLTDLSLDLPLVIEFFDEPARVQKILGAIAPHIKPGHVLTWTGRIFDGN